jgi:hypothetical protein
MDGSATLPDPQHFYKDDLYLSAVTEKRRPKRAATPPELDPLATIDLILLGLKPSTTEEVRPFITA